MSTMGRYPLQTQPALLLAGFSILIGCLAVHFLVEDFTFHSETGVSGQASTETRQAGFDGLEHQDDLALLSQLFDLPGTHPLVVLAQDLNSQKPFISPLLLPPKI